MFKLYVKNPFNYIGAKYKLLDQIYPLFPKEQDIDRFIDLFGGSGEVGINLPYNTKVIYNEKSKPFTELMNCLTNCDFVNLVEDYIHKFNLSKTGKEEFLKLRTYYNKNKDNLSIQDSSAILYCLIVHSFNYQIAFNSKGEFNMPSGYNRSWFSPQLKSKLENYIEVMQKKDITIHCGDFDSLNIESLHKNDFIYADPPYLITVGGYERDYFCKWSEQYEMELLNMLSILDQKGIKFALSNVIEHKGKTNEILKKWSEQYNVHHLNKDYKNCNYQTNSREIRTSDEVLITNY